MTILVTGASGQLGSHICYELMQRNLHYFAASHNKLDITNQEQLNRILSEQKPNIIINCAAFTAVDLAERENAACAKVNQKAVAHLAKYCRTHDALLIHFSTDYVFDGEKDTRYTEFDKTNPINYYGLSKRAGELEIENSGCRYYIIRTSWLYSQTGRNFYTTMAKLSQQAIPVKVVTDQIGTPTKATDLAKLVIWLLSEVSIPVGTYHFAGGEVMSRYEFAKQIFAQHHAVATLLPIVSSEYPSAAKRPKQTALKTSMAFLDFQDLSTL